MFLQLIFHRFSIFSYYILEGNWFMTLRWTLPLLSPFDFKHPNNSYTLVLGQILISDLWGTATLSFSCSLFSIRVVRSWSLRLRWDFLSSSAWCFQFCFIHSKYKLEWLQAKARAGRVRASSKWDTMLITAFFLQTEWSGLRDHHLPYSILRSNPTR